MSFSSFPLQEVIVSIYAVGSECIYSVPSLSSGFRVGLIVARNGDSLKVIKVCVCVCVGRRGN